ncbi:MAG: DUF5011 domain-containing protein [Oscillospiraceae bacterium]|nr:DUF5011 domain-containing protein [Oscillospiraceae bacterium]
MIGLAVCFAVLSAFALIVLTRGSEAAPAEEPSAPAYISPPATWAQYTVIDPLIIELGSPRRVITAADFIFNAPEEDGFTLVTDLSGLDFNALGQVELIITLNGEGRRFTVEVRDLIPPEATPVHVTKWLDEAFSPEEFVTDIIDQTEVTVTFAAPPDGSLEGEQEVFLLLTDESGNTTSITSKLTLMRDTEPPVITGLLDKSMFLGDTIAYRFGITVTDNRDEEVELMVDSGAVDTRKEGVYPVIYSATDSSGNKTAVKGTVTVFEVTREQVDEMADEILEVIFVKGELIDDEFIEEEMTPYEKAFAIYQWVQDHIIYINSSIKDDPYYAAYRGFRDMTGDCYVHYAVSEILLTRAGIDNVPIERIPGQRAMHYWSLINLGEGWYHFDATPHESGGDGFYFTESQARALLKGRSSTYYTYDTELYPEVVP